jgi:glyoxylate/hydroxypyruvate reductase A
MNILLCGDFDAAEARDLAPRAGRRDARGAVARPGAGARATRQRERRGGGQPAAGQPAGAAALRLIQSLWAGVDRLLADGTLPAGVPIARMVDPAMNTAMAETALWATLALQRDFFTVRPAAARVPNGAAPAAPRRRMAGAGAGPGRDGPHRSARAGAAGFPRHRLVAAGAAEPACGACTATPPCGRPCRRRRCWSTCCR